MSTYEHTDDSGDKIRFNGSGHDVLVESDPYVSILNADAPTVALELLKAAGQESVIVPKKLAGEVVAHKHALYCGGGDSEVAIEHHTPPARLRTIAANYIALAEYVEGDAAREAAKKAEAEAAEKELRERRDAVAAELSEGRRSYDATSLTAQTAIDLIITLQDKLAAK